MGCLVRSDPAVPLPCNNGDFGRVAGSGGGDSIMSCVVSAMAFFVGIRDVRAIGLVA